MAAAASQQVTSLQLACFPVPCEMTRNNNTVADVVNDPVNPNNGGESVSVSKSSSSQHLRPSQPPPPRPVAAPALLHEKKKEKSNPLAFESLAADVPQLSTLRHSSKCLLSAQLHSPLLLLSSSSSSPLPPPGLTYPSSLHSPGLRHSRGKGRSSLCASLGGRLRACGPSCASAWMTGWGSTPGRWCIGRARRHCGCAGA